VKTVPLTQKFCNFCYGDRGLETLRKKESGKYHGQKIREKEEKVGKRHAKKERRR